MNTGKTPVLRGADVKFQGESYTVTMVDHSPCSGDGRADPGYDREYDFSGEYQPTSRHGIVCRDVTGAEHSCVLVAGGGPTGVHEHSAVIVGKRLFVAVGDRLCSLSLPELTLNWSLKVDSATCFGVYYSTGYDTLLSHGELEIARVSLSGELVWSFGGADIFSEGLLLFPDHIETADFNRAVYHIDIATGSEELQI